MSLPAAVNAYWSLPGLLATLKTLSPFTREVDLQQAVRRLLTLNRISHEAEKRLDPKNRLDFYLEGDAGRVAIECKARQGGGLETDRQVQRYALTGLLDHIIILASKPLNLQRTTYQSGERTVQVHIIDLSQNALL